MLIISDFSDYYDTIAKYGVDKMCVYKRTKIILKGGFELNGKSRWSKSWPYPEEFQKTRSGVAHKYSASKYIIGFCGNLYPVVVIRKTTPSKDKEEPKIQEFLFYCVEKVVEFFEKEQIKLDKKLYYHNFSVSDSLSLKDFFSSNEFNPLKEEFHKNKCPVFIYGKFQVDNRDKDQLILNPKLKDYRFFQVKDPQTAFQDIFMFISGVLGIDAPDMVELKDKELAAKKGHGDKYSFRKPPGKRGKKRWR